ncbi:glutathione ABC transporter substrate-binding protein [Alkaliphilus sp. MSJ-5]|uniref:Glutathione ABC transporter substrate-binding protein n=1 Tax=Alkaliphilus flagellatus TaxID=2841507 RepID=A0ABS6G6Y1_9FIRM|nr:glutathione ABC transporter substrate-binding protein [Alkaliphilus flagellatus]MBU5678248.1 glutathione ABC transporter substrate-binding protein [Alkaliphilus flagellatus]
MKKNKKLLMLLSMILAFALIVVGCGKTTTTDNSDPDQPKDTGSVKDTLVVAQGADAKTLDPHGSNDNTSSRVIKQINDTLVVQDENMELQPGLAESWEKIDDLTFEFKLKQGVKFHNGEEFKASDVKFTLLRALESPHVGHIVGAINKDGIEIVDDYTIRIATTEPFAPLLSHLAHTGSSILNEKAVTDAGDDYGQKPVGTGPFKFENWVNGDEINLVKFEEYHGEKAKVAKVKFRNISEATNRTINLETGEVDIVYDVLPTDVKRVEEDKNLVLMRQENLSTTYIGFNVQKKPFDDVRVRQAINHAVDVDSIIEAVMQGVGEQANGPLGPNVWASNQKLVPYEYNVEKAKELMKEAGLENGFKTSIWTNDNKSRMDIAEIVQNQLKAINIEAEVKVVEWGAYLDGTAKGEHDMFILGWVTVTGDPDYGLYPLFHSSQFGDAGNRTFYGNTKVDELLDKARKSADQAEREKAYLEVQEVVRDDAPWIFLNNGENVDGLRSNVKGFVQHPAGHHRLGSVYFE